MITDLLKNTFAAVGLEVSRTDPMPAPTLRYSTMCRFLYFKEMLDWVGYVKGDIGECGVGKGSSLLMLAILAKSEMKGRKVWGFDSFEGFPEPTDGDERLRGAKKGMWGDTSLQAVIRVLRGGELDEQHLRSQITLAKGCFQDSVSKYAGTSIALLHIDVDLMTPT